VKEILIKMELSELKSKKEIFGLIKRRVGTTDANKSEKQCPKTLYLYYTTTMLCCLAFKSSLLRFFRSQVDLACTPSKPSDFA